MIPFYVEKAQSCEQCDADLYIGYDVAIYDNSLFCDEYCVRDFLTDNINVKKVYLTSDRSFIDV